MLPSCQATSSQLTVGRSTAGKIPSASKQGLNLVPSVSQSSHYACLHMHILTWSCYSWCLTFAVFLLHVFSVLDPVSIYPVRASMVLLPSGGTNSSLLVAAHGTPLGQHVVCVFVADGSAPQCGAWTDSYASSSLVMVDTPSVKATLEFTAPTLTCPGSFHIVVTRPLAANQPTVTVTTMLVNPFPIFGSAPPVSTYSHEVGTPVPASRDYPATC